MKSIFLSASVPLPDRDPRYYETADLIAIRDAVRALATVVLPHAALHWGGHPSITPLIRLVAEDIGITDGVHVHLYQSGFFSTVFPDDNAVFERYELTPARASREESLREMRIMMLKAARFDAGIFIGGMDGVEKEFALFREFNPRAVVMPIASTGAAARMIYERESARLKLPHDLLDEYAYPSLFRRMIGLPAF